MLDHVDCLRVALPDIDSVRSAITDHVQTVGRVWGSQRDTSRC